MRTFNETHKIIYDSMLCEQVSNNRFLSPKNKCQSKLCTHAKLQRKHSVYFRFHSYDGRIRFMIFTLVPSRNKNGRTGKLGTKVYIFCICVFVTLHPSFMLIY
jgi:hypothetical protein